MSRFLKIGAIVAVAFGVIFLGYWLNARKEKVVDAPGLDENTSNIIGGSLAGNESVPEESLGDLKPLFSQKIIGFFAGPKDIVGVNEDGQILSLIDNRTEVISSSSSALVTRAEFSFDGKRILLQLGPFNSPFYKVFDTDKRTWKDLPFIISPVWSPKTHEIAYLDKKTSGNTINILNADSPAPSGKVVLQANLEDVVLLWPKINQFIMEGRGTAYAASSVWRVDRNKKTWLPVVVERSSLSLKWNSDGDTALALTGSGRGGKLSLINDRGEALRELTILTLPEKCAFTADSLVCAVPEDRKRLETSFLPDDYLKESFFTKDSFLEIDLISGEVKSLNWSGEADATNVQAEEKRVFFINRLDGKLYSIKR